MAIKKIDFKNLDNKSKIEIAITAFMVIAFIIILANSAKTILHARRPRQPAPPAPAVARDAAGHAATTPAGPQKITPEEPKKPRVTQDYEQMAWGNDPFHEGGPSVSNLKLEGILWDNVAPRAIINNEIVAKGEKVAGNTVIAIQQDRVILNDGNKNFELRLE